MQASDSLPPTNLDTAAVAAFTRGGSWHQFVGLHPDAIQRAERAHPGTVARLLHLLTTGEYGGMEPPPDPWRYEQTTLFDTSEAYA